MTSLADPAGGTAPATALGAPASGRRRPDRVLLAGLALVALATGFRAWAVSRTWFYLDDFPLVATAVHDGLSLEYLFTPHIGHLMPAGRLSAWVIGQGTHYDYSLVTVQLIGLYLLCGLGMLRLLRTLFGSRWAILLPLTCFLFSPWLISPTTWWAAGINHLPALLATIGVLDQVVRHLREPRVRHVVGSVSWMLLGLAFAELAMFAYVPVVVIALGYFARGWLGARIWQVVRHYRTMVIAHAVLVVGYLGLYLWRHVQAFADEPAVPWRGYAINMIGTVLPSGFIGGPGRWHQVWTAQFETQPATALQVLGIAALIGTFALSAATRVRGLRAWWIPALQTVAIVLLVGQNRAVFGAFFILDMRFSIPLAVGLPLALGLAFLPVPGAVESAEPRSHHWLVDRPGPARVALCGFVGLSVWSTTTFPLVDLPERSPRNYFANFERTLSGRDGPIDLIDIPTPTYVYGGSWRYSVLLSPYGDALRYPAVVQDDFYVLGDSGRLTRPALDAVRSSVPPATVLRSNDRDCRGYPVPASGQTIGLTGPVMGYFWRMRIEYSATGTTPIEVSFGGTTTRTTARRGRHVMEMPATPPGMWSSVRISASRPTARLCVSRLLVGTPTTPGDLAPEDER